MPKGFEIGVITSLRQDGDSFAHVSQFGLHVCQLGNWDEKLWALSLARKARRDAQRAQVRIAAVWAGDG